MSGAHGDFHVVENFVQLLPIMGTTTGADIFKPLLQCLEALNLNLSKPVLTTTDRAPSMEKYRGCGFASKTRGIPWN